MEAVRKQHEGIRENSELLTRAAVMARAFFRDEIDFDSRRELLDRYFKNHDSESYDCHSFVLSLLKRECGLPVITAPDIEKPDRNDFEFEVEWQEALFRKLEEMYKMEEWGEFREQNMRFTESLFENSTQIDIPHQNYSPQEDPDYATYNEIAKRVTNIFRDRAQSRVLLISNGRDDKFKDVHSTYVLGIDDNGEDLLLLEKEQVGASVQVRRLSEVLFTYSLSFRFSELEINICEKPIEKVLQLDGNNE